MAKYEVSDYVDPIQSVVKKVNVRSRAEACPIGKAFIVRGSTQSGVAGMVYPVAKSMGAKFKVNKMEDGVYQVTRIS